jgi:penicillin-binding protein 1A
MIKKGIIWGVGFYIGVWLIGGLTYYLLSRNLPPLSLIETYKPPLATEVYDRNGELLFQFFVERREPVSLKEVPESLIKAFIALEDHRFYQHWGVSLRDVIRAIFVNLKSLRKVQGASTITQQLARNMFLTQERTIKRKLEEAILALKIERAFSKDEILEKYLNQIYFGHGVYGVAAASKFYFGKDVSELNLAEAALLVGIPRSPLLYSPFRNFERSKRRQEIVLKTMLKRGFITKDTYEAALKTEIILKEREKGEFGNKVAPYFMEMVRRYVSERYGDEFLYTSGGKIYTTLDKEMQMEAERIMEETLEELEEKYDITPKKGDKADTLSPPQYLQAALLTLDIHTGKILVLIGGRDYRESQFNRATQAKRQPGSAFKAFVYTAAIDNGYNPSDRILDIPVAIMGMGEEGIWYPENYDHTYMGEISLRKALARSRNLATINLILELGPSTVAEYARRMGIKSPIPPYPSIAIGSATLSLLEITRGYATLANYGVKTTPYFIEKITDADGNILEMNTPKEEMVLDSVTSYILINMLESVFEEGTAVSARTIYDFDRPAGGKTGTTDEYHDAWFIGFTPDFVTGVWVGFDSLRTITEGATGSRFALPIWAKFMKRITEDDTISNFVIPQGVVFAEVCASSGLLWTPYCPEKRMEVFREGNEPEDLCNIHTPYAEREMEKIFELIEREAIQSKF